MNTRDQGLTLIPDVQSTVDTRRVAIQSVGIRAVKYPILLDMLGQQPLPTVAEFEMTVFLPAEQKGTHMSRFIALLEETQGKPFGLNTFRAILKDMLGLLEAPSGRIKMNMPYFLSKVAPVSGVSSLMDYQLGLEGVQNEGGDSEVFLSVVVPVTSLCPCSKKISAYGAHNQRSHVTVKAQLHGEVDIAQLISTIEKQASCELYGLLKRPDEKYVTERAYDNPKFVEDLVRDVAIALNALEPIGTYVVEAENFESIHNHSAYARIEKN